MKDVVDKLGQVHKLVQVKLDDGLSCNQCSMLVRHENGSTSCNELVMNNYDCFQDPNVSTAFAYKIVADTVVVG